jgi:hypothetical protein
MGLRYALHNWRVILPSRRVRTRTHGGVTGKASDRLPLSIPWPASGAGSECEVAECMVRRLTAREKLVDGESLRQCIRPGWQ